MHSPESYSASALSSKWLVLDCGEYLEVREVPCGGGGSTHGVRKQALFNAKWNATDESYVLASGEVFSVRGMPAQVKDEIERVHISGTIDKKAADLEQALKKQRSSDRILSGYDLFSLAVVIAAFLWIVSLQQPLAYFLAPVPLIVAIASRRRFAKRFAAWSGFLAFEDLLFIRVKRAIDELDRFVVDRRNEFLDEGIKLLNVSSLTREWTTRRTNSRVVQRVENEVEHLTQNITSRIAPYVRRSRDPKTISQLVLGRLRPLLPIVAKPDVSAIASWNDAARNEFPTLESRAPLTRLRRIFVSRPRVLKSLSFAALLLAGYAMSALIMFGWQSILRGYILQIGEFSALVSEFFSTYLLLSTALAALLATVWLRK